MDPITAIYLGYGLVRDAIRSADNVLKTFETAAAIPGRVKQLYSHVSATSFGAAAEQRLNQSSVKDLIPLGPNAFVNNAMIEVRNLGQHAVLNDPDRLVRLFQPLTRVADDCIFSSQVTSMPHATATDNPWKVLHDPRPLTMVSGPPSADHVPVIFEHGGMPFVGWQLRAVLPQLFGIESQSATSVRQQTVAPQLAHRLLERTVAAKVKGVSLLPSKHLTGGAWLGFALATDPTCVQGGYQFLFSGKTVQLDYSPIGFGGFKQHSETFDLHEFRDFRIKPRNWTGGMSLLFRNGRSLTLRNLVAQKHAVRFFLILREELG